MSLMQMNLIFAALLLVFLWACFGVFRQIVRLRAPSLFRLDIHVPRLPKFNFAKLLKNSSEVQSVETIPATQRRRTVGNVVKKEPKSAGDLIFDVLEEVFEDFISGQISLAEYRSRVEDELARLQSMRSERGLSGEAACLDGVVNHVNSGDEMFVEAIEAVEWCIDWADKRSKDYKGTVDCDRTELNLP